MTKEMGEKMAKNYGVEHYEVSALTGLNVHETYNLFITELAK